MNLNIALSGQVLEVSEAVFGRGFNEALVHQVVVAYMAGRRQGTRAQKNRAEVAGGGRKPWRQKGTGRARAGTIRSPIWRGGGVTFAARPRDYGQKVNRKMYRGAMCSILSELVRGERLVVVEAFDVDTPKTKDLLARLAELALANVLVVTHEASENLRLSARNLRGVDVLNVAATSPLSLLSHDKVLMTVAAIRHFEVRLAIAQVEEAA